MAEYVFTETPERDGSVRIHWAKLDPLDFWVVPVGEVEAAKARVRSGEFEEFGARQEKHG
jgi:hypothetical protein